MSYIRWFDEISKSDLGLVGGKGANLGELTRAGLPVPPGFCLTSAAYQDFIRQSGLDAIIASSLASMQLQDLDDIRRRAEAIQSAIQAAPLPPAIVEQVAAGYRRLNEQTMPDGPVAVRSSATAEDQANASFAGQLETYLNIRGIPALLEYVKHCWASLWAERVVSYIANQGLDHHTVSMSVVVQAMIPSEVSGVLFTVNPVTGSRDEAVMNASYGLGEAIVSGLVSPDTITARKSDGRIVDSQVGPKEVMIAYASGGDTDGGTEELPVAPELRSRLALSERQVAELVSLGCQIEEYFGKPQDIEWGYWNERWYLLQSRPITTLAHAAAHTYPPGDFNRSMFIEIFPDPLSPIFLSVIQPMFENMLDYTFRALGFEPDASVQATGGFYNQPYFNQDYIAAAFRPLSPAVRDPLVAQVVNPFSSHNTTARFELSRPYLRLAASVLNFMVRFPRRLPELLRIYHAEIEAVNAMPLDRLSDQEIADLIRRLPFEHAGRLLNNDFLMIAVIGRSYHVLGSLLQRRYQGDTDEVVARLITGVTGNITMKTNQRLWDLAQIAKASPTVSAILRENDAAHLRPLLLESEDGRKFLQAVDQFLAEYGHREVHMDIIYPTWGEDPGPVYSFIRSYLDADDTQSPYYQQERLIREREDLTRSVNRDLEKTLAGRLALAPIFRWFLHQTQLHTRERDTMHFEMTRLFPPLRRLALELGRRWAERGLLEQPDDVFFLELDEYFEMIRTPFPAQERVSERRETFERNRRQPCPPIIRNGQEIFAAGAVPDAEAADPAGGLRGIAGSPGTVTGVTRVIYGPEDFSKLKKGEILVAPITNPVWTPLFAVASAVITEVGGILSHGAIVAREYGIPAVMSVSGATSLLQDGLRITVDGTKGLVYLAEEA